VQPLGLRQQAAEAYGEEEDLEVSVGAVVSLMKMMLVGQAVQETIQMQMQYFRKE
jgi:hypothetical protein